MKLSVFLCYLSIVCLGCGLSQNQGMMPILDSNPPFEVLSVTATPWVSGVRGGGSGINIEIQLNKPSDALRYVYYQDQKAQIDYRKSDLKASIYRAYISTPPQAPRELILHNDPIKEYGNPPPLFRLKKDQAAIVYIKKKKTYYTIVHKVQREPSINYM